MSRICAWSGWCGYWLAIIVGFILISSFVIRSALAHDWYIGQQNAVGWSCCYGKGEASRDCANVISDHAVVETKDGYIVTLTKVEMLLIKPSLKDSSDFAKLENGIREFIPYGDARPAWDGSYSVCLSANAISWRPGEPQKWVRCFFFPSNS